MSQATLANPTHTCHLPGCDVAVEPSKLMCFPHWRLVPKPLQQAVWKTYRPGQEIDKNPSQTYLSAAGAAIEAALRQVQGQSKPAIAEPLAAMRPPQPDAGEDLSEFTAIISRARRCNRALFDKQLRAYLFRRYVLDNRDFNPDWDGDTMILQLSSIELKALAQTLVKGGYMAAVEQRHERKRSLFAEKIAASLERSPPFTAPINPADFP